MSGSVIEDQARIAEEKERDLADSGQSQLVLLFSYVATYFFQETLITVPMYIYPDKAAHSEPCLLGTNVVIPLNLMVPHTGLVTHPTNPVVTSSHPATIAVTAT